MHRIVALAVVAFLAVCALGTGPGAQAQQGAAASVATEPEPLVQSRPRRARPHIRVRPLYPYRSFHTPYPLPYDVEYPGPNAKRACVANYVREYRPSGTVIVPRMRCWWVPG